MSENDQVSEAQPAAAGSKDERTWAMLCHLSALAAFVIPYFGAIIGPLIVWLIKKDQYPLVDREGKKALNFQITIAIVCAVLFPTVFILIGIPLLLIVGVLWLIFTIVASVKTSNGVDYKYPFAISFFK